MIFNRDRAYVIAEAGTQHAGSSDDAHQIVSYAAGREADAVKFQVFTGEETVFCWMPGDDMRWDRWQNSALSFNQWSEVKAHADAAGIDLLFSAFQPTVVQWIDDLRLRAHKVASRAINSYPYKYADGPFLISTGLTGLLLDQEAAEKAYLMQCRMEYPHAPMEWRGDMPGLSDHSGSPWPAIDAIARGCEIIEVHVTFLPQCEADAAVSVTQEELGLICDARDQIAALRARSGARRNELSRAAG